ncbi:hypothetical protein ABPG74_011847 [Tetrahymena malaccensis]
MKRKYFNYSLVFYNRDEPLKQLQQDVEYGIQLSHLNQQISNQTSTLFKKFNESDIIAQRDLIKNSAAIYFSIFFEILTEAYEDQKIMRYLLPTIDGIIMDNRRVLQNIVQSISDQDPSKNWLTALNLIIQSDNNHITVIEAALRIKACIIGELDKKIYLKEQQEFLLKLLNLQNENNKCGQVEDYCLITCLSFILKQAHLVNKFIDNRGQERIYQILKKNKNDLQIMYYTLLVLWLLSFCEKSIDSFLQPNLRFISSMVEIIQKLSREKLIRVAFQCLKNLAEKSQQCIEVMVDCDLLKLCETLLKGNIKDKEVVDDVTFLGEILEKNIKILTSFEKYIKEINLQQLEWSPVHTEKFWKENVKKFDENDYHLIKKLCDLLDSDIPKNVAIACYDIGEFCRFHPFGRNIIESLNKKNVIMQKARDQKVDSSVRENALLALQKIMLHNWSSVNK